MRSREEIVQEINSDPGDNFKIVYPEISRFEELFDPMDSPSKMFTFGCVWVSGNIIPYQPKDFLSRWVADNCTLPMATVKYQFNTSLIENYTLVYVRYADFIGTKWIAIIETDSVPEPDTEEIFHQRKFHRINFYG